MSEIFNAEVLFREDCTPDEFIDVVVGNRIYMPCLYVSVAQRSFAPLRTHYFQHSPPPPPLFRLHANRLFTP